MIQNGPLVSVIIPVYNHPEWLEKSIKSVLEQTYKNIEIIVINDGSTDDIDSMEILKDKRIKYCKNRNFGVAYSRNYGVKLAKGKYVAFLDSDDIWMNDKLSLQIAKMEEDNTVWSQHDYYYFDDKTGQNTKYISTYCYRKDTIWYYFTSFKVQTSCFVIRRDVLVKNDICFDENKEYGEEGRIYLELAMKYKLICLKKPLSRFRIRGANSGLDCKKQLYSRANCYIENKDKDIFWRYTTKTTRLAYKYCYKIAGRFQYNNLSLKYAKVLYMAPWILFKINSKIIPHPLLRKLL